MKKTIYIIISLICIAEATVSCASYLDRMPQNQVRPVTTDDFMQLLNKGYITEQVMPYLDILSDDVDLISDNYVTTSSYDNPNLGDKMLSAYMWQPSHELSMSPGDIAFEKFYQSIYYSNLVLSNIGNASASSLDISGLEAVRGNIKGEALALRAWSYFYLVNLYARDYDPATCADDPGVPYIEDTYAEDMVYRRSSVKVIYEHIVSDLQEAVRLLTLYPADKSSKFKFNALSAEAFLARVYLFMERWDEAAVCAEHVLSVNSSLFSLAGAGEVLDMDNNYIRYEAQIELPGDNYIDPANENILFVNGINELMPALSSWPIFTTFSVSPSLAETYEPGDIRRLYFMVTFEVPFFDTVKLTYAKSRNIRPLPAPSLDAGYTRVIRTEEMYLILAEASARTGKSDKAVDNLNMLRKTKFTPDAYHALTAGDFSEDALLQFIFEERRRELCFEGHRWFDLRRSGCPAMERTGYDDKKAELKENDPRYVLQIPQYELTVNPEIGVNPR